MLKLPATKYPTTQRIVNGTVTVYPDDVVLLCDTSTAPVIINLAEIPQNAFSTQYKLYIVDKSGNANTNNITINAGINTSISPSVQQTINTTPSLVINVDNGEAVVTITSNSTYIATLNYSGSTPLPTGFIEVTYLELLALINANTIIPNGDYLLLDANYGNAPIIPTKVYLKGITTNEVTTSGQGIFFNADYQTQGNYSGITGFVAQLGIWDSGLAPVLNDVVIWNNFHFKNITGANGVTNPVTDTTNWLQLALSITNGYIQEIDSVVYNIQQNSIFSRLDERLNYVEAGSSSFNLFKWGSDAIFSNNLSADSSVNNCNTEIQGDFFNNTFNICKINFYDVNKKGEIIEFKNNTIISSVLDLKDKTCLFNLNYLSSVSLVVSMDISNSEFIENNIYNSNITITDLQNFFKKNTIKNSEITITTQNGLFGGNTIKGITSTIGTNQDFVNNTFNQGIINIPTNENIINNNNSFDSSLTITNVGGGCEFRNNTMDNSTIIIASNEGSIVTNNFNNSGLEITTINQGVIDSNDFLNKTNFVIQTNGINGIIISNVFSGIDQVVKFGNNGRFIKNRFINVLELEIEANEALITQNQGLNIEIFRITSTNYNSIRFNSISFDSSFFILGTTTATGEIFNNSISENSSLRITNNDGQIYANTISSSSKIQIETNNLGASLAYNQVSNESTLEITTNNGKIGETTTENGNVFTNNTIVTIGIFGGILTRNNVISSTLNLSGGGIFSSNNLNLAIITLNSSGGGFNLNDIFNSTLVFTTSNNEFQQNRINYTYLTVVNNNGSINENIIENSTTNFGNLSISAEFKRNTFNNITFLFANANDEFNDNSLEYLNYQFTNQNGKRFNKVNLSNVNFVFPVLTQDYIDKYADPINSNIQEELDMSDPAIFDTGTGTLTVDTNKGNVAGILLLTKPPAFSIRKIVTTAPREITYIPDTGTIAFDSETIATASTDEIISDLGTHTFSVTYRVDGCDSINIKRQGTLNAVKSYNIFT
jgi:hypothetical protein